MDKHSDSRPAAVILNVFYTGLAIARSLSRRGVRTIGLSAARPHYGNFTRRAEVRVAPDSRHQPEELFRFLLALGAELSDRPVLFPTRDDDIVFLDRYRAELEPLFRLPIPASSVVSACLDKWETYLAACRAEVETPKCWMLNSAEDARRVAEEAAYPCVLKPVASHHWRQGSNWSIVGGRKAFGVANAADLRAEYASIAQADPRALAQELIAGADDQLVVVACYMDLQSRWVAGFNARKLLQIPEGFGTGCIVSTADQPGLFERTERLLRSMRFTGIAEVEYKWDATAGDFKLIEINCRPWDQHSLGQAAGVDVIWLAYCEHAGLSVSRPKADSAACKWIADDAFFMAALRFAATADLKNLRKVFRLARGKRVWAIWRASDPAPFFCFLFLQFLPAVAGMVWRKLRPGFSGAFGLTPARDRGVREAGLGKTG